MGVIAEKLKAFLFALKDSVNALEEKEVTAPEKIRLSEISDYIDIVLLDSSSKKDTSVDKNTKRSIKESLQLLPRILDKIKASLAGKGVFASSLKVSEVPDRIREILLEKYVINITATEFEGETLTVSSSSESKTCVVKSGKATVKFKNSGTFRILGPKGDYEDITVGKDSYSNEVTLVKKKATLTAEFSDDITINVTISRLVGKNTNEAKAVLKRNGSVISCSSEMTDEKITITNYEYIKGAGYSVEYQLDGEERGSVEVTIITDAILRSFHGTHDEPPTHIIFTDQKAPYGTEVKDCSKYRNGKVVKWLDQSSDTLYISTQKTGTKIVLDENCEGFFVYVSDDYVMQNKKTVSIKFDNIDTSKVTNMLEFFAGCFVLEELDLSNFDFSNVKKMIQMFRYCEALKSIKTNGFNASPSDIHHMFEGCLELTSVDLSNLQTKNLSSVTGCFKNCTNLTTIKAQEWSNALSVSGTTNRDVFENCTSLPGFSDWKTDVTMAKWKENGGYFTKPT